ncbi:hypothetical protein M9H77_22871 [Catharanthus roseus]|uniref:Uncharacterized protein n=1 Tax=Catharanthus roseus TaxID=4058 RepID=A0ACC0AVR4_CATRO|nr:hypothetical protein M9H77_22871 [Catharanthus roseus]
MSASLKNKRVKKVQREKELVVLEKRTENFEDSRKDEGGKLAYKSIKTINFFPSNPTEALRFILRKLIPRVDECHFNIPNYDSCVLGVVDKGRSMEEELGNIFEDLSISLYDFLLKHFGVMIEEDLNKYSKMSSFGYPVTSLKSDILPSIAKMTHSSKWP